MTMADALARRRPSESSFVSGRFALGLLGALVVLAIVLRVADPGRIAWVQAALIAFGGLIVQATPFVLIGALASAAIEVFVPPSTLDRIADLPRPLQLPAAGLAGIAFPLCECGSVPVARRLIRKGLAPGAAITFMLAAPVVNPVVVASTFVAYRDRGPLWTMVAGRFTIGLLVAIAAGWVLGAVPMDRLGRAEDGDEHVPLRLGSPEPRWRTFFAHVGNDFLFMGRFLLVGATLAALVQAFLPQSIATTVAAIPVLDIVVMMGLAFVLSLCSESDAFIAASFAQFGPASQLAFLVFGPMVDFKLAALYAGSFGRRPLRAIVVTVAAATLAATLWVSVIAG
jgi:uncharacterized membrane protein YraQ (UPF0718 family)